MLNNIHYTHPYFINPPHPITVAVIGCGGNGSQMLMQLARINESLKKLGHIGLHVTAFDNDIISEANMGRQLFSPAELGLNKSVALITRINRFYANSWKAVPHLFNETMPPEYTAANLFISCVDTIKSRKEIEQTINRPYPVNMVGPEYIPRYWMDLGNSKHTGQFIIGTLKNTGNSSPKMPCVFKKFPGMKKQKEEDSGPSCSLAEALNKQDLFINSTLAQLASGLLWKMFREGKIDYQGAFLNLQTLQIAKIKI